MDAQTINQTVDLLPLVGELKKSGAFFVGPCPMCAGRDRFTVKHTPGGDRWHCRRCGDGKWHNVVDFIMARDHVSFVDACQKLVGEVVPLCRGTTKEQPKAQPARPVELPDASTQAAMIKAMNAAADNLFSMSLAACDAQDYLRSRALTVGTWEAWHIGAANVYDPSTKTTRPAVLLPWYYMDAQREYITAVKHRFIDELAKQHEHRFGAMGGGKTHLPYGLWAANKADKTLLIIEGEFNALSVWQCQPVGVSVLSIGSQKGARVDVLAKIADNYQNVFIWCDEPEITSDYIKQIAQPGQYKKGLQTPEIDGVKLDANKLLQRGQLIEFINKVIGVECR